MTATALWKWLREQALAAPSPELAAHAVLRACEIDAPAVPVNAICAALGVKVVMADGMDPLLGFLDTKSDAPVIYVAAGSSPTRTRFTVAHEFGHLMLHPLGTHYRESSSVTMNVPPRNDAHRREQEANRFAANLLMPGYLLEPELARGASDRELAALFQVSLTSMAWQTSHLR